MAPCCPRTSAVPRAGRTVLDRPIQKVRPIYRGRAIDLPRGLQLIVAGLLEALPINQLARHVSEYSHGATGPEHREEILQRIDVNDGPSALV